MGIDRETAAEFTRDMPARLTELLGRFKSGRYHAPAVRRAYIPKASGGVRPLGIPTFEDKVLQRAVAMVLGAVYEQDFLPCSYGFRPGRSAHDALSALRGHLTELKAGCWKSIFEASSTLSTTGISKRSSPGEYTME